MIDPADISKLESAFAENPAEAFEPLTKAYLAQSRFMEAMVVCKKGIKANPNEISGRLLLSQVYLEQGKVPKATAELEKVLAAHPDAADAHVLAAQIHEKAERYDDSIASYQHALTLDPSHAGAVEALRAKGFDVQVGPSKEELAAQAEAEAKAAAEKAEAEAAEAQRQASLAAAQAARPIRPAAVPQEISGIQPAPAQSGVHSAPPQAAFQSAFSGGYDPVAENKKRQKRLGLGFTFAAAGVLVVILALLIGVLLYNKKNSEEVAKFTTSADQNLKKDSTSLLLKSVASYEKALEVDSDHEAALAKRAYVYQVLSERGYREATLKELVSQGGTPFHYKESLAQASDDAADHPYTMVAKAIAALRQKAPADALAALKDAPPSAFTDLWRARALIESGKIDEGMKLVEKNLKTVTQPALLAIMGDAYRATGDLSKAKQLLSSAISSTKNHDVARANRAMLSLQLADISFARGDTSHLLAMGQSAVAPKPFALMQMARGEIARLNDREGEATADFKAATDAFPKDADILLVAARGFSAKGKKDQAFDAALAATKSDPHRVDVWTEAIRYASQAKKVEEAEKVFKSGKAIFGDHPKLVAARGWIGLVNKDLDGSIKKIDAANKAAGAKNATLLTMLGFLQLKKKDLPAAEATLLEASKHLGGSTGYEHAVTYTTLGRVFIAQEQYGKAKLSLQDAIKRNGSYPEAYYYMGMVSEGLGNMSEAKTWYGGAIKVGLEGGRKRSAQGKLR